MDSSAALERYTVHYCGERVQRGWEFLLYTAPERGTGTRIVPRLSRLKLGATTEVLRPTADRDSCTSTYATLQIVGIKQRTQVADGYECPAALLSAFLYNDSYTFYEATSYLVYFFCIATWNNLLRTWYTFFLYSYLESFYTAVLFYCRQAKLRVGDCGLTL